MKIVLAIGLFGIALAIAALALDPEMDIACAVASLHDRTTRTHTGWHCIHYAAARGDRHAVMSSLRNGVTVNRRTDNGQTPLMLAAREGRLDIVKALINVNAGLQARDARNGFTALHWAADRYHPAVSRALIDAGARVDAANQWKQTPLWQAAGRRDQGNTEIAHILVAAGADFTHADSDGNTPLLRAAYVGHRPMVAYLIGLGCDPSARNARGETPLWRALSQRHVETVRVLLAGGADPNTGVGGVTPLEHALKHTGDGTQGAMVALLRANGATGYRRYAASAARQRGRDAALSGRYTAAIDAFDTAIRLEPGSAAAFYRRGLAYSGNGDRAKAVTDFTQALTLDPGLDGAREALARAHVHAGQYTRALTTLNRLIADQPDNAAALYLLGESHSRLGDTAHAIDYYDRACRLGFKTACPQAK